VNSARLRSAVQVEIVDESSDLAAPPQSEASPNDTTIFRIVHLKPNSYKRPTASFDTLNKESIAIQLYDQRDAGGDRRQVMRNHATPSQIANLFCSVGHDRALTMIGSLTQWCPTRNSVLCTLHLWLAISLEVPWTPMSRKVSKRLIEMWCES
jgi:hypothetical protein